MESCRSSVSKIISCSVRKSGSQSACLQCGASSIRKAFTRYPVDNNLLRAEPFPQSSVYGGGNGVFLSLSSGAVSASIAARPSTLYLPCSRPREMLASYPHTQPSRSQGVRDACRVNHRTPTPDSSSIITFLCVALGCTV